MFKISWARKNDNFHRVFIIVPDVHTLFEAHFVITGYGRDDGSAPIDVVVTNLDGYVVDMTMGLADAAGLGTYSHK